MTIAERNSKLKHYITCLKCGLSGKCCDDNCPTQYVAGNMGEIVENLEAISKALEQEPILDKIRAEIERYKSTIDKSISEDELKIEGMKEAYADLVDIIDKYKAEIKSQESEG